MTKNYVAAGDYAGQDVIKGFGKEFYFMKGLTKTKFESSDVASASLYNAAPGNSGFFSLFRSRRNDEYLYTIEFCDGKRSLLSLDKSTYMYLLKILFR